ncbi:MAG: DMT family transporter [Alphaproteobacteria bacterium]|nr:DMT family transporter [Alphaproteobacteria bacterium]
MNDPAAAPRADAPIAAIAYKVAATLSFAAMAASIKLLDEGFPVGEVVFFRSAFALPVVLAWAYVTGRVGDSWRTTNVWFHVSRSTVGMAAMFLSFVALADLPLADWTVIGFAMPIFATILAAALLNEPVGPWRAAAVAAGFAGVLVIVGPKLSFAHGVPALIMLVSTLCAGLVIVIIRKISATENGSAIAFYFMLSCTAMGALTLPFAWKTPEGWSLALLIASGVFGGLGQVCNTFAYARAQPSMLGPFDYMGLIWATALGVLLFGEWPDATVWAGAAVIVASGVVIAVREGRHGLQKPRIPSV